MHIRNVKSSRSLLDLSHAIVDFASSILRTWEEHFFRYKIYFTLASESIIRYTRMAKLKNQFLHLIPTDGKISAYARIFTRNWQQDQTARTKFDKIICQDIYSIEITLYPSSVLRFLLCIRVNSV